MTLSFRKLLSVLCCLALAQPSAFAEKHKKAMPSETTTSAPGTEPAHKLTSALSVEEYEHLLNILFPIDHATPIGLDYSIVLRFEPDLHPESQVTLRCFHDGHFEATFERVLEGNAWRVAEGRRLPGQFLDLAAIAKDVPTRKYSVMLDTRQLEQWHHELFPTLAAEYAHVRRIDKTVRKTGERQVVLGGTRYEIWVLQGDDEIHTVAWDAEVDALPTGTFAIARWANEIRFYAANHILATPPPPQAPIVTKIAEMAQ